MEGIEDMESLKQENFEGLLRVSELEENIARLEWELEMAQSQKEQAEAKVATLESRAQSGKKEGSKELRSLMAAEAEKARAVEQLIAEEAKKSRQREEKLREMQKRMAVWEKKSPEHDMGEQKEKKLRLEVSKNLIAALQEENRSQATQIESLQESLGIWQERCDQAERLVEELRKKLAENHVQVEETRRVIIREMERMKEYTASHEAQQDQKQSLKAEVEVKTKECGELQARWQRAEEERDQCRKEIQSLKDLLKESTAGETAALREREQRLVQAAQTQREQLSVVAEQLEKQVFWANTVCQEQWQELGTLRATLIEAGEWTERARTIYLKGRANPEIQENIGKRIPKEEKGTMTTEPPETEVVVTGKESVPTIVIRLEREWKRWTEQYALELNSLRERVEELSRRNDVGVIPVSSPV
ncbi:hypothetical protein Y1Q_0019428 [Alligator mississippiensis]|uniref:Uncharacterized protein n=1 Tax=Alligator mississippiensis TaxID=8496 RepID=A0A151P4P8_ALLMI|nr:hypothetical protein Y1Q_0019428 [Alligator mississippiensis]